MFLAQHQPQSNIAQTQLSPSIAPLQHTATPLPMSRLSTLLNAIDSAPSEVSTNNTKPFLLYRGSLTPEREEAFKIYPYPVIINSAEMPNINSNTNPNTTNNSYSVLTSYNYSSSIESSRASSVCDNTSLNSITPVSSSDEESTDIGHNDDNSKQCANYKSCNNIKVTTNSCGDGKCKYKCNYPNCRYKGTFLSKDYLRRHVREQHKRAREHICLGYHSNGEKWGCNKKFSRPYQLVNHWKGQRSLKSCGVPESELRKAGVLNLVHTYYTCEK